MSGSNQGRSSSGGSQRRGDRASRGGGAGRKGKGESKGKGRQGGGKPRRQGSGGKGRGSGGDDTVAKLSGPLENVLKRLPETQRRVLELRMGLADGHPHDLADTARALGLSQSETRDIERRAFEHIREVVPLERLHKLLGN